MKAPLILALLAVAGASSPAAAKQPIAAQLPCWMIRSLIAQVGGEALAEQVALSRGYTPAQITATKKRCHI